MARPIMPTPEVTGQDAEDLRASLDTHASKEEMKIRSEQARAHLEEMMRPKTPPAAGHQAKARTLEEILRHLKRRDNLL
jgi:hypothetical protein